MEPRYLHSRRYRMYRRRFRGVPAMVGSLACALGAGLLSVPGLVPWPPWATHGAAHGAATGGEKGAAAHGALDQLATAQGSEQRASVLSGAPSELAFPPVAAWQQFPGMVVTPDTMEGDAPNPFIFEVGGNYYMYSSQGNVLAVDANIPLRTSTDLFHWSSPSDAMPTMPSWASTGLNWSPDVHYIAGRYVMWFSAVTRGIRHPTTGDGLMKCIGWATSPVPSGPFVPDPTTSPAICQVSRFGSIDPHLFEDPSGKWWVVFKSEDNAAAYHPQPTVIWAQQLAPDGTGIVGNPVQLISADQPWQANIVENGQMVFADGRYWLFYSSNGFSTANYSIDYDSCAGPTGPCTAPTILLGSNAQGQGPGEAEVFIDDTQRIWMVYAPWAEDPTAYSARPVALTRLGFSAGGPYLADP